jgi:hypothetical protein
MKKAIVLMMTLGFIAIITALVLYSLSISKRSFDVVAMIDAQNQFSLAFKDFDAILKTSTKEVKDADTLDMLLAASTIPPMTEPKTGVTVGFSMESKMKKLNINSILSQLLPDGNCDENLNSELLCRPLERFFDLYEIRDKRVMLDIMLDTMDRDDMELGSDTEIANEDIDFAQGKIYSYNHLQKIFKRYYQLTSDKNIFKIDREKVESVFYFGDTNVSKQMLDCRPNLMGGEDVFSYILPSHMIALEVAEPDYYCALFRDKSPALETEPELRNLKKLFRIKQFDLNDTKSKYLLKCNLILGTANQENELLFTYDLTHKKIESIDEFVSK